ncbi:hypothetical protein [Microvirga subterranea]|uniref:Uncharacterized protein n=1 Tax=Microvirga subterranea TaxID=186651 RepID=A0A370HNG3_9HYPH|nr:hypothetical protein [Microvirga subterranea]RDI60078.1 hypothetical protein DES45_103339 [Microvirga subterranea]
MEQIGRKTSTKPTGCALLGDHAGRAFLDALLDPASVFRSPADVAEHPGFTDEEKRTILLSWVRDELVVEQVARQADPDLGARSRIDAVIEALSHFDPCAAGEYLSAVTKLRTGRMRRRSS